MFSDMLFTYGKLRTKDSYKDTSQGSGEIKLVNLGFDNSKKISSSSHYKLPWQRKLSTKYPATKREQGPHFSLSNQLEEYGLEGTLADNEEMEGNPDDIREKEGQNPYAYEDIPHKSENEEISDDNRYMFDEDSGDDNGDDDVENDFAPEIHETLTNDGSNTGMQAIYEQKDGVQSVLNRVPYPAKTEDGTRSYKSGRISRFSENGPKNCDWTQYIIQSRIDHLKDNIKRQMATHNNLNLRLQ
jgi:hypothetical protein